MKATNIQFSKNEINEMLETMHRMTNAEIDDTIQLFINLAFDAPELFRQLKTGAERAKEENRKRRGHAMIKGLKWAY